MTAHTKNQNLFDFTDNVKLISYYYSNDKNI